MVFDSDLVLESVAGPGARTWRYAERNVTPGWALADMMPSDVLSILQPHYEAALRGHAGTLEYHSVRTGLDFTIQAVPMAEPDGHIGHVLVMISDVTTRRAHEEALRVADQRYRTAFESAPVGMAQINLDGRFEDVNAALCALVGRSADELCTMRYEAIVHPDARPRIGVYRSQANAQETSSCRFPARPLCALFVSLVKLCQLSIS